MEYSEYLSAYISALAAWRKYNIQVDRSEYEDEPYETIRRWWEESGHNYVDWTSVLDMGVGSTFRKHNG